MTMPASEFRYREYAPSTAPFRLARLLGRITRGEPDLTDRQLALLMLVAWTKGPHRVKDVAAKIGVAKPVISRALNNLGSLGFLVRTNDHDDRRQCYIEATDDGRSFLQRYIEQ